MFEASSPLLASRGRQRQGVVTSGEGYTMALAELASMSLDCSVLFRECWIAFMCHPLYFLVLSFGWELCFLILVVFPVFAVVFCDYILGCNCPLVLSCYAALAVAVVICGLPHYVMKVQTVSLPTVAP